MQDYLADGAIDMGHARALLALPAGAAGRRPPRGSSDGKLSVRETERLVSSLLARARRRRAAAPRVRWMPTRRVCETDLAEKLGAKVKHRAGPQRRGRVVISYASLDQLDGILARFK